MNCPLCGNIVVGGKCKSCGYVLPLDEELDQMSYIYDLDPDNDNKIAGNPKNALPKANEELYCEIDSIEALSPNNIPVDDLGAEYKFQARLDEQQRKDYDRKIKEMNERNFPQNTNIAPNETKNYSNSFLELFSAESIMKRQRVYFAISVLVPFVGIFFGVQVLNGSKSFVNRLIGIMLIVTGIIRTFFL